MCFSFIANFFGFLLARCFRKTPHNFFGFILARRFRQKPQKKALLSCLYYMQIIVDCQWKFVVNEA